MCNPFWSFFFYKYLLFTSFSIPINLFRLFILIFTSSHLCSSKLTHCSCPFFKSKRLPISKLCLESVYIKQKRSKKGYTILHEISPTYNFLRLCNHFSLQLSSVSCYSLQWSHVQNQLGPKNYSIQSTIHRTFTLSLNLPGRYLSQSEI